MKEEQQANDDKKDIDCPSWKRNVNNCLPRSSLISLKYIKISFFIIFMDSTNY